MAYTIATPIMGPSLGDPAALKQWVRDQGTTKHLDDADRHIDGLYFWGPKLGVAAHVAFAQTLDEASSRNGKIPYDSEWWDERLATAGIGITGDPKQDAVSRVWPSGWIAALGQCLHLFLYAKGTSLPADMQQYQGEDPRWDEAVRVGRAGIAPTLKGLANTWAANPNYAVQIAGHLNRLAAAGLLDKPAPTIPDASPSGGSPVVTSPPIEQAYKAWNVPGCKRPLLLPAWIKVVIRPVDLARVRSYEKWAKSMTTVHDTGNPRTNAQGEYDWLAAGRPGGEVGGYEWISDDTIVIWTGWVDETTWAQGVQNGNRISHAGEIAFGAGAVFTDAWEIACAVHGGILEMDNITSADADVLHQAWYGKWCAQEILNRGLWPQTHTKIQAYRRAAAAFRATGEVIDVNGTVYAERSMPIDPATGKAWDGKADITVNGVKFEGQVTTGKTLADLNQRQWASTESLPTGPLLDAGTSLELLGWVAGELVDGISEWWIRKDGSRLWAGGVDAVPKVDPDYGQDPEPPTGDVELPTHGPVPVNGRLYYPLFDEASADQGEPVLGRKITIERAGNLYKWADTTTPVVGTVSPAATGQSAVEHVFKYWTRGEELPLTMKNAAGETVTINEPIWYAEDLYEGARMWSGLSTERPD